ncbi:hypothetical protein JXQ31_00445 [candidate division KSB1 bacterium]|nr:hypothetical protein [candidate division KSB1 bacterium]
MNCLIIAQPENPVTHVLELFLKRNQVACETVHDLISGIQNAQLFNYDLIILNTRLNDSQIDREIRLLKGFNPLARIIVHTDSNSRALETAVRKEQVFYYHVNTLGINVLRKAVKSALGLN